VGLEAGKGVDIRVVSGVISVFSDEIMFACELLRSFFRPSLASHLFHFFVMLLNQVCYPSRTPLVSFYCFIRAFSSVLCRRILAKSRMPMQKSRIAVMVDFDDAYLKVHTFKQDWKGTGIPPSPQSSP